jgi:TRAP-type mannitol/chloroaromatic compound transport system substrate-binding protein
MQKRDFLKKSALALTGVASAGVMASCSTDNKESHLIHSQEKFEWRCVTVWPPNFPILGEAVVKMAEELFVMSAGRLKIHVYGANELVPALESFDAVTLGAVQMAHGASYYWAGKIPAAVFFTAVPFGMNVQQMTAWLFYGGGWELWKELYAKFGLVVFPCGNTGVQVGGWFNKEINTAEDLKGLKMRIPGLGGAVLTKAGGASITIPGNEVYTNLERGVVDAAEWIGPYHDYLLGLHRVAKFCYYPGWQETSAGLELICNQKAFSELPADIQKMVETVAIKYNSLILAECEQKNRSYMHKIFQESQAKFLPFPEEVMKVLKSHAEEVIKSVADKDEFAAKVYESFLKFKNEAMEWSKVTEQAVFPYL